MNKRTIEAGHLNVDVLRAMDIGDEVTIKLPTEIACDNAQKYVYISQKRVRKRFSTSVNLIDREVTITCVKRLTD
ncbi:MAG: hypothetical protein MSG77_07645 [Prevotella sp.]|nr:hypothetical protein [Prevotella sp.]